MNFLVFIIFIMVRFFYIIKYEEIFFFSSFGIKLGIKLAASCKKQIIWLISFSLGLFWIALCEVIEECLGIFFGRKWINLQLIRVRSREYFFINNDTFIMICLKIPGDLEKVIMSRANLVWKYKICMNYARYRRILFYISN